MQYATEFRYYLTSVRKSSKTGAAYSPKVVTDLLRRCKTIESKLSIELSESTITPDKLELICKKIREERLCSTARVPYAHLSLVNAARIYADFMSWRLSKIA